MATAKIEGTQYELTGSGLGDGDQYAASIVYDPDGGGAGRNTGMSAQYVQGGSVTFVQAVAFLTGGNRTPGSLKGWLRAATSSFSGDPVGPVATIRVNE